MRYLRIINRLIHSIPMWFRMKREFNGEVALYLCLAYILPSKKGQRYMNSLRDFFSDDLRELVRAYQSEKNVESESEDCDHKIPLWTCWLTGYENMPELVRLCYHQMIKRAPKNMVNIILITLDNYRDYVKIPDFIVEKYHKGMVSPAHFSDIIRFCLLSTYGGMWLDSTVYTSGNIPKEYFEAEYYTQKVRDKNRYPKEPSRAQWCGFIWAGKKGNLLFSFVRDGLFYYWEKYDFPIDYIFFDYIIMTAYDNIPAIRNMMDAQVPNNEEIWGLWNVINEEYNEKTFQMICENNIFHKLTYKGELRKKTASGARTMYGYLLAEDKGR